LSQESLGNPSDLAVGSAKSVEKKIYKVEDVLIDMLRGKDGWIQLA
jgi:hypothetical protein